MMKMDGRRKQTATRRSKILAAALSCFTERGYEATTIEEIRARSRASVGSLYHHFGGKEALARAVYVEGIRDYQTGMLAVAGRETDARSGILALVTRHLSWVREQPDWALFLARMRHAEFMKEANPEMSALNRAFGRGLYAWARSRTEEGALRRLPLDLFFAYLLGPCQEYVALWAAGIAPTGFDEAAAELGRGAWLALRAEDTGRKEE